MKKLIIGGLIIAIVMILLFVLGIFTQKDHYPQLDLSKAKAGDFVVESGKSKNKYYKSYPKKIKTTFGTIAVPENRTKQNSRLISLPIKKLHSFSENPKEPIFLLYGGPGASNLKSAPVVWLLENHDLIMVGYRGIDGSVFLDAPEIAKAMTVGDDPLGKTNIENLASTSLKAFNKLKDEGIDMDAYNMVEVLDDINDARKALGYEKLNFYSQSYGTRLAYLYGLRYPKNVYRSILAGVNPPGRFVWEPHLTDSIFYKLSEQWKQDSVCITKSPDILKTIENVLSQLPRKWRRITINPNKVKIMMFMMGYQRNGFSQTFDAFVSAEKGDFSGIAFLSMAYDQLPNTKGMSFAENFAKALSADTDPNRDYENVMDPEASVIGAPLSKLFAISNYGGWPMKQIPEDYRRLHHSNVETLLLSGSLDISTPIQNAKELLQYLPNGHQVIFENRGHQDIGLLQNDAYHVLVNSYYQEGIINDNGISNVPMDFDDPSPSFQKMGKIFRFLKRIGLTNLAMKIMN